jgi:hypothetical protein
VRTETELLNTPDAQVWAQEFMERFGKTLGDKPARVIDEGLMIGWFANAIECGKAAGYATAIADRDEPMLAGVRRCVRRIWARLKLALNVPT